MKREYFRFTELIERYGYNRDDLVYRAESGDLPIHILAVGLRGSNELWEGTLPLGPHRIGAPQFLSVLCGKPLERLWLQREASFWHGFGECVYELEAPTIFNERDLVIMAADLGELPEEGAESLSITGEKIVWTWPRMEKFTGLTRKTIGNRAEQLGIDFLEHPPKRGSTPEKGLKESDLRRIVNNK